MSAQGNEKHYQEVIKTGIERIGPIALEDRLKALGFEIDLGRLFTCFDCLQADRETAIDCKFLYPKNIDSVDVAALIELRKSVFCFVNGFWWIF